MLPTIPDQSEGFRHVLKQIFPELKRSDVTLRTIERPNRPTVTLAFIPSLIEVSDLRSIVLDPLTKQLPDGGPDRLAQSGFFPAPVLTAIDDTDDLQKGLLTGLAAIHVAGHKGVLLVGSGTGAEPAQVFGPDLTYNLGLMRQEVRDPSLRIEILPGGEGTHSAIVYLDGKVRPETLKGVRAWAGGLKLGPPHGSIWSTLPRLIRFPVALEISAPATVASILRNGYIAVLVDHAPVALVAPATLARMLDGAKDPSLPMMLRRTARWVRLQAVMSVLFLSPLFVALSSYHHTLIPGPFLIALSATRQNVPFPTAVEILLVDLLDDGMYSAVMMILGRRWGFLSLLGTILACLVALEAGVLSPLAVAVSIPATIAAHMLPSPGLVRIARLWRYFFLGCAAGLGIFGLATGLFIMMVYLGHEQCFGQPIRSTPEAASS